MAVRAAWNVWASRPRLVIVLSPRLSEELGLGGSAKGWTLNASDTAGRSIPYTIISQYPFVGLTEHDRFFARWSVGAAGAAVPEVGMAPLDVADVYVVKNVQIPKYHTLERWVPPSAR